MIILQALYLMLPAYLANMAPVFAARIFGKRFALPLDFNLKLKGREILGANKTWRGLVTAVIIGILTMYLQKWLEQYGFFKSIGLLDYENINLGLTGFLFGFGVILGDAVKSFFKRRFDLQPGARWPFYDQLDFLGALLLLFFVYLPPWPIILTVIIISPLLPLAANWLGYKMGIKSVSW